MPVISVEGPPIEDMDRKRTFVGALTDAAEKAFGLSRHAIIVLLKENRADNVGAGGELISDRMKK
jgi:4-oxalocrotonate tautomerase